VNDIYKCAKQIDSNTRPRFLNILLMHITSVVMGYCVGTKTSQPLAVVPWIIMFGFYEWRCLLES